MARLSDLTRRPSLHAGLSHPSVEDEGLWQSQEQRDLLCVDHSNDGVGTSEEPAGEELDLEELVKRKFASTAALVSKDSLMSFVGDMRNAALRMVYELNQSEQLVSRVFSASASSSPLTLNSFNVAVLATKIGMGLNYPQNELMDLSWVALLHDIGKFLVLESLEGTSDIRGACDEVHLANIPELGCEILENLNVEPWLAEVVWQEHERWGGEGYPKGLKGEEIHKYAQIMGLAHRFDTMINEEGHPACDAIRLLLTKEKTAFRGQLLKALVHQISLFPVGTVVRLTTGEMGTVEKTNLHYPLRPVVRMQRLGNGQSGNEASLRDLSRDTLVHIKEVIKDHEQL